VYPPSPYAKPIGSFQTPVLPPTSAPADSPTKSFSINCQWLPYVRGALKQLLLQSTWNLEGTELSLGEIQGAVFDLIDIFKECDESTIPFFCSGDFRSSSSPFGTWVLTDLPPTIGTWVSMAGYQTTVSTLGTSTYNGVTLDVTFDTPLNGAVFEILYDLSKGEVNDGSELACYVYDYDHAHHLAGSKSFTALEEGNGLTLSFGPAENGASHFQIRFFAASRSGGSSPSPAGLGYLLGVTVSGDAGTDPCT